MKRLPRREQGLTLIEVLVALTIFGFLIAIVFAGLPASYRVNRANSDNVSAVRYARTVMESTRAFWLSKATTGSAGADSYPNFTAGTLPTNLPTVPPGLSCPAPTVTNVSSGAQVNRRRVSLSCTPTQGGSTMTFVVEFGRPE